MVEQQKRYVWNAEDYAKNSASQYTWAKELIPKLKLSGNEVLLDVGCGDGKVTAVIAQCLPRGCVVGVDNSEGMIHLAQCSFPQEAYPNLSFQRMDARVLTFQEKFDRVFSNAALHWILDQSAVLAGIQRSLKAGGQLLLQMGGKGNAKDVLSILDDLLFEAPWKRFFKGFTFPYAFCGTEEYGALLVEAGLEPKRVELMPKIMNLNGAEGLAGWIRTTWLPYTERLPLEQRDAFVKEIVNRYIDRHPADAEGIVHLNMVRLEVEASKPASKQ
jgi:trans-aconitate 2-methyltransferase